MWIGWRDFQEIFSFVCWTGFLEAKEQMSKSDKFQAQLFRGEMEKQPASFSRRIDL